MKVINGIENINKNNIPFKPMYGFKCNFSFVEKEYIKNVEHKKYLDYASNDYVDVILIELNNGCKISVDCDDENSAIEQVKLFKKDKFKVV